MHESDSSASLSLSDLLAASGSESHDEDTAASLFASEPAPHQESSRAADDAADSLSVLFSLGLTSDDATPTDTATSTEKPAERAENTSFDLASLLGVENAEPLQQREQIAEPEPQTDLAQLLGIAADATTAAEEKPTPKAEPKFELNFSSEPRVDAKSEQRTAAPVQAEPAVAQEQTGAPEVHAEKPKEAQPAVQPAAKEEVEPSYKSKWGTEPKIERKTSFTSVSKQDVQPQQQDDKPASKQEAAANLKEVTQEQKPEVKTQPDVEPAPESHVAARVQSSPQVAASDDVSTQATEAKAEPKAEPTPEAQPEVKLDSEAQPEPEAKPQTKSEPEVVTEAQAEPTVAAESQPQPEPQPETEPQPEPAPKAQAEQEPASDSAAATKPLPTPEQEQEPSEDAEWKALEPLIEAHAAPDGTPAAPFVPTPEKRRAAEKVAAAKGRRRLRVAAVVLTVIALALGSIAVYTFAIPHDQSGASAAATQGASEVTYGYRVKASNGTWCDARETARYNDASQLVSSTVEVTFPSLEEAESFVTQMKADFGSQLTDSSIDGARASVTLQASGEEVSRGAYEALLQQNLDGFRKL